MGKKDLIEKVYPRKTNSIVPTLLTFQNGHLTVTEKAKVQYSTMVNKEKNAKEALVVVEGNVYTGPVNASEANELTDLYICVRNKTTNKVRIMPIDQAQLQNRIYSSIQQKTLEQLDTKKPSDSLTARMRLIKEFSGSKIKRIMDNREKMQINMEVVKGDLEATIENTTIVDETAESEEQRETYIQMICPKYNADATNIEDIYSLNDLVPQELLNKLNAEAQAVLVEANENLPIKSAFLLQRLEKIKLSSKPQTEVLNDIKIIIFMDGLFNLITSKGRVMHKIELSGITTKVENYIRRSFALPGAAMLVKLRKKALCYYMVLCMLYDENHLVDTTMLAKELGLRLPEIIKHAHVVNALPSKSSKDCVVLTLPCKVPAVKSSFKKKNK